MKSGTLAWTVLAGVLAAAGCGPTKTSTVMQSLPAQPPKQKFTAGFDLGLSVAATQTATSTTNKFVQLGDTVSQTDNLNTQANTAPSAGPIVCTVGNAAETNTKTTTQSIATTTLSSRIAGKQHAWMLLNAYFGNASGGSSAADNNVNVSGRPDRGFLFVTKPQLDIYLAVQAQAQCNCNLKNYVDSLETDLYLLEDDTDTNTTSTTTTLQTFGTGTTTTTDVNINNVTSPNLRSLNTAALYLLAKYVWQTGVLSGLYTAGAVPFTASMIAPDDVTVGDTWLDNNGNINAAVTTENLTIDGKTYTTLVIVTRGHTDIDMSQGGKGLWGWCIQQFTQRKNDVTAVGQTSTTQLNSILTDNCNNAPPFSGVGGNQVGTGWINLVKTWYYKGLIVKQVKDVVDVAVQRFGFAIPNDGTAFFMTPPNIPNNGAGVGQCATFDNGGSAGNAASPTTFAAAAPLYKPYAIYTVTNTHTELMATKVRRDFTIQKEYAEQNSGTTP